MTERQTYELIAQLKALTDQAQKIGLELEHITAAADQQASALKDVLCYPADDKPPRILVGLCNPVEVIEF